MEQLENAEYYMRAFESEQIVRRKIELENADLKNALKNMVEKLELNRKIYESLLAGKGLNAELLDIEKPLNAEQKSIIVPQNDATTPTPASNALAPRAEEGF